MLLLLLILQCDLASAFIGNRCNRLNLCAAALNSPNQEDVKEKFPSAPATAPLLQIDQDSGAVVMKGRPYAISDSSAGADTDPDAGKLASYLVLALVPALWGTYTPAVKVMPCLFPVSVHDSPVFYFT